MQSVINSVKGTALGVAEYLTPVLKVLMYVYLLIALKYKMCLKAENFMSIDYLKYQLFYKFNLKREHCVKQT